MLSLLIPLRKFYWGNGDVGPTGRTADLEPISCGGVSLVLTSPAGLIGLQLTQRGRHAVTESFELKWPRPARL